MSQQQVFLYHLQQLATEASTLVLYCRTQDGALAKLVVRDFNHYFYSSQPSFGLPLRLDILNAAVAHEIKRCDVWQKPKRFSAYRPPRHHQRISEADDDDEDADEDDDDLDADDDDAAADIDEDTENVVAALVPVAVEPIYYHKKNYVRHESKHCQVVLNYAHRVNEVARVLQRMGLDTYENKAITHVFRFLIDKEMTPCGWFLLDTDQLVELGEGWGEGRTFLAPHTAFSPDMSERSDIPPLVSLTLDLECASLDGSFPQPEKDPVIQISTLENRIGQAETRELLFTWRETDDIKGVEIVLCRDEHDMFMRFHEYLVRGVDPDYIVGYNTGMNC